MDFNKLRDDLQSRYFSTWEYISNGSNFLKIFSKNHPILLFCHFLFSFFLGVVVLFQGSEVIAVMDKIVKNYGDMRIDSSQFLRSKEFNELMSEVMLFMLCFIIVWLIVQFISAVIRKKIGLEMEDRTKEYRLVEVIIKFIVMTSVNIIFATLLVIVGIIMAVFTNSMLPFMMLWIILQVNILYFEQAYYLRNINIIEAFKYNLYLSKGNRVRILVALLTVFGIYAAINYFSSWLFEVTIKNQVALMTVNAAFGGILGLLCTIFVIMIENIVYLNLEYIDFNNE